MELGDGAFGRCVNHERGARMNGISACSESLRGAPQLFLLREGTRRDAQLGRETSRAHAGTLASDCQAPEPQATHFCFS